MTHAAPLAPVVAPASAQATAPLPASRALDALALRAQRREPGAEDELLAVLLRRLRPIVAHRCARNARGALTAADVDDAVQDIALIVWKKDLPVFDPKKSGFLTFLSRRIDWHLSDRARAARRHMGEALADGAQATLVDDDKDPEALLAAAEAERALLAMPRLVAEVAPTAAARLVLVRHDLEGATLAEVAKELNVHVSNACRARQRGLLHLRRQLTALAA